jgi:sulfopyruvate decarboxylase subunit alpha
MNPSLAVYQGMKRAGINFVTSVPCVNLQELLDRVREDVEIIHVPVTREEEGVGLCAGAWMDLLYGIPLLMIISHRGGIGEPIIGQVPMGRLTVPLLEAMAIPHFEPQQGAAEEIVAQAWSQAALGCCPVAVLLDLEFWRVR